MRKVIIACALVMGCAGFNMGGRTKINKEQMKLKWRTQTEYVDLETGEVISKSRYERGYHKIMTETITSKIEVLISGKYERYGIKKCTIQCRPTGQTRIKFGND